MGLKLRVVVDDAGLVAGPSAKWWAAEVECPSPVGLAGLEGVSPSPSKAQLLDRSLSVKACL